MLVEKDIYLGEGLKNPLLEANQLSKESFYYFVSKPGGYIDLDRSWAMPFDR